MKILVALAFDAGNFNVVNIVKILERRNHRLYLYALSMDTHNIWMFGNLQSRIKHIDELTDDVVEQVDIILAPSTIERKFLNYKKYIFTINQNEFGTMKIWGGDIMFLPTYQKYERCPEEVLSITIGNFKKEKSVAERDNATLHHNFLFIDSGHYPFSLEGKKCVAKLLIDICNKFKDYSLTVKPRFLYNDKDLTHPNRYHLYDALNEECDSELPSNLVLLNEHLPMNELIDAADVVLCMYTAAYFDVAECGKRSIVIQGLPNCDTFDLNNEIHWKSMEKILSQSGCMIHYKNVIDFLPEGLVCNEQFIQEHLPSFNGKSAPENAADIIEYCFDNFISQGKFITNVDCTAANYKNLMQEATEESWVTMLDRRYRNMIWLIAAKYLDWIHSDVIREEFKEKFGQESNSWIKNADNDYVKLEQIVFKELHSIVIKHYEDLRGDAVQEAYYLDALGDIDFSKFSQYKRDDFICKRSYDFFYARKLFEEGDHYNAEKYFLQYLKETAEAPFREYYTDIPGYIDLAYTYLANIFPFSRINKGSTVLIYGAGVYGREYLRQVRKTGHCNCTAFVDKRAAEITDAKIKVILPADILSCKYDFIVISVVNPQIRGEIKEELIEMGIEEQKIVSGLAR